MRRYLVAAAVVALVLPALGAAKGPVSASISGKGLERTLTIAGDGEAVGTQLGALTMRSGFFAQMFGQTPDPTLRTRPASTLGPRYTVIYVVPGPNDIQSRVVQRIYPFAKPVALSYMKPGQPFWESDRTHGGWYKASLALKRILIRAGVPTAQT
ncbi:MAG: hypothetical protein ABWY51_09645 [Gaiellaceae bacterium]